MSNEELCALAKAGDREAENELFLRILPSLKEAAAGYGSAFSSLNVEASDLLQEASIGFLRAVRTYCPEKGSLFRTYVSRVAENAMLDHVRKCASLTPPTGPALSIDERPQNDEEDGDDGESLYDRLASPYVKTPEQICMEKETYEEVHHALGMISERERTYLWYRYGFDDDVLHDREETAGHFHLSPGRARSIERQALDNVRLELPWW